MYHNVQECLGGRTSYNKNHREVYTTSGPTLHFRPPMPFSLGGDVAPALWEGPLHPLWQCSWFTYLAVIIAVLYQPLPEMEQCQYTYQKPLALGL